MTLTLAVLGDSIAYGQGAARPADAIGARLAAALTEQGRPTSARVLAVPGARSAGLAAQARRAAADVASIALIVIGANDLTHFVSPQVAAGQLADAVAALRRAGSAVVVGPAPDMSVIPAVPPQLRPVVRMASATLREAQTRAAIAAGARVVDVESSVADAFAHDPSLFSADRFHPSSAGYELIARALLPAVAAAAREVMERSA